MDLLEKVKKKTILFDGALGTMLMDSGHASTRSPILLNLEQPAEVAGIHKQYFDAGSDVVVTNTFGGNPLKLAAFGIEQRVEPLNREGVRLVRAGCPDGKTYYAQTPAEFAADAGKIKNAGADMIGGSCGSLLRYRRL